MLAAVINLSMGSASAKWAIMAPVFVPMFMLLGYSPELTQAAYRVGDSVTNVISPMMTYFALIIAFVQRYEPKAGLGTVVATMLPYSLVFWIGWTLLFVAWMLLDLPVGPGAPMLPARRRSRAALSTAEMRARSPMRRARGTSGSCHRFIFVVPTPIGPPDSAGGRRGRGGP